MNVFNGTEIGFFFKDNLEKINFRMVPDIRFQRSMINTDNFVSWNQLRGNSNTSHVSYNAIRRSHGRGLKVEVK